MFSEDFKNEIEGVINDAIKALLEEYLPLEYNSEDLNRIADDTTEQIKNEIKRTIMRYH